MEPAERDTRLTRRGEAGLKLILGFNRAEFTWAELMDAFQHAERLSPGNARVRTHRVLAELRRVGLVRKLGSRRGSYRMTHAGDWKRVETVVQEAGATASRGAASTRSYPVYAARRIVGETWFAWKGKAPPQLALLPELAHDPAVRGAHPLLRPPFNRTPLPLEELKDFLEVEERIAALVRHRPALGPLLVHAAVTAAMSSTSMVVVGFPMRVERIKGPPTGWALRPRWLLSGSSRRAQDASAIERAWDRLRLLRERGADPRRDRTVTKYLRPVKGGTPEYGLAR